LIGKAGSPQSYNNFSVSPDGQAFAFATNEGVLIYKSKNIITDSLKDSTISFDKTPVNYVGFASDPNASVIGLYAVAKNSVWVVPNINKDARKKLTQGVFKYNDINERGELVSISDNNQMQSFSLTDRLKGWPYDEEKFVNSFVFF
jgi:hypothetical protein